MTQVKEQQTFNYSPGKGLTVRLRGKRIAGGMISLYLDYYQGHTKDSDGKIKTIRKKETLKMYLVEKPNTPILRTSNNETIALAQDIRAKRESTIKFSSEGFVAPHKKKTNLFDYCQAYIRDYKKGDIRMIKSSIRLFFEFIDSEFVLPYQVDEKIIIGYRDFLLERYNGETPKSYFDRFKKVLRAAVKDNLFTVNPAQDVVCKAPDGLSKDILLPNEIINLVNAKCEHKEVRRAFLLSLNTGLGFADIIDLKHLHIKDGRISKARTKTSKALNIQLNQNAIGLIGEHSQKEEMVFNLPSFGTCLKWLRRWVESAGIDKHITWHSARHSFGTILVMNKNDIITVKNLLGHSKLEHTQKYTHVVDILKQQAVDGLPKM